MGNFTDVYVLQSENYPGRFYTGCIDNFRARLSATTEECAARSGAGAAADQNTCWLLQLKTRS